MITLKYYPKLKDLTNTSPPDEPEAIKNNVTEETREKPHGVGFIFLLASSKIHEKKKPTP